MIGKKHIRRVRIGFTILFGIYIVVLIYLLFFMEMRTYLSSSGIHYNLVPFHEISRFIRYWDVVGPWSALMNIGGNIALFVPFGFCCPELFRRMRSFGATVAAGACLSICVEVLQLFTGLGCCDIDDVILNTAGTVIGYIVYAILYHYAVRRIRQHNARERIMRHSRAERSGKIPEDRKPQNDRTKESNRRDTDLAGTTTVLRTQNSYRPE